MTQTFTGGDQPKAGMVFEGDFAQVNISEAKAKVGTDAKVFPFPAVGDTAPVVSGGDAAVILKDSKAAQALATFLASPDAATIQAKLGGYLSPNKSVAISAYPNAVQQKIAKALIAAGRRLPLRHVRPGPAGLRRHARQGRVEGAAGLPEEPEGHRGHAGRSWRPTRPRPTGTDAMTSATDGRGPADPPAAARSRARA